MSFVTLKDVYKRYHVGEVTINAADGMTFDIEKGELAVIVGPSGSGKTTVLNMLGGMDSSDEGEISVDGQRIDRYNRKQLTLYRRFDIGFIFQFYNLLPNLTAKPALISSMPSPVSIRFCAKPAISPVETSLSAMPKNGIWP